MSWLTEFPAMDPDTLREFKKAIDSGYHEF
jgi:hypothetical protein